MLVVTEKGRELRSRLLARLLEPPATVTALPASLRRRLAEILGAVLKEREDPTHGK
jgi:hypothetical protein